MYLMQDKNDISVMFICESLLLCKKKKDVVEICMKYFITASNMLQFKPLNEPNCLVKLTLSLAFLLNVYKMLNKFSWW